MAGMRPSAVDVGGATRTSRLAIFSYEALMGKSRWNRGGAKPWRARHTNPGCVTERVHTVMPCIEKSHEI